MSTAIEFQHLSKRFGPQPALAQVHFSIAAGCFFGLAGVNGAGKTTLIKCLLDFCRPDQGDVRLFGHSSRMAQSRSCLAYLPERFTPPYYLTGGDFLRFMAELHGQPWQAGAVHQALTALELEPQTLTRPVRSFSKGMTQKLGLLAAFLSGKQLLVLDEPMSGLDPKARALVKTQLAALRSQGRTLFFTAHALADITEVCDEMAVLDGGRLLFCGQPDALQQQFGAATLEAAFLACISQTQAAA